MGQGDCNALRDDNCTIRNDFKIHIAEALKSNDKQHSKCMLVLL